MDVSLTIAGIVLGLLVFLAALIAVEWRNRE